jgi:branched-chain amino acid transport system permease protein
VLLFRGGVVEWVQERWKLLRKQRSNQAVAAAADEPGRRSVDALVDLLLPLRSLDGRRTLRATGVVKHYGGVRALDFEEGDEFDVATGEVHLLLGPNGSGKTTLLNALNGLVRVAGGTVALDGESINRKPVAAIARAGIARSFQSPALPDEVTPAELFTTAILAMQRIGYFHWVLSDAKANRARRQSRGLALRLAATSGLAAVADTPCSALTSGQRRMVDVLQALLSDSAIVLLDEPAAGLSDDEREHLSATVKALARRGLGFVVVEHDLELALSFADRVTVMADGRPVAHGQPDEILSRDIVKTVLIGTTS